LQDFATKYWIQKGAPKDKLNLGIGAYGCSFTLQNANNNGVGAPEKVPVNLAHTQNKEAL
jgi:chitinase